MSGGSKSSSASTSTNITNTTDKRLIVDGGSLGVSADNSIVTASINVTDSGAIKNALDFATNTAKLNAGNLDNSLEFAADSYKNLIDLTKDTLGGVFSLVKANNAAVEAVSQSATSAIVKANEAANQSNNDNRYLVAAGLAVVGLVAVKVWAK